MSTAAEPGDVDFSAEGLLEGLEGDERAARLELLERLSEAGVPLDELRRAVAEDRLALLPVERALTGDERYTVEELAGQAGLETDTLRRYMRAIGFPDPEPGARRFDDDDLEASKTIARFRDAGLADAQMLEIARVLGLGLSRAAEAMRSAVGEAFLRPGDTERDLGLRYVQAAETLHPLVAPLLQQILRVHLREHVRSDVVDRAARASGRLPGTTDVAVAFVDVVGFTRLGEQVPPDELGGLADHLADLTADVAVSPVRLVKTIGDEVMLVSTEVDPMLDTVLTLIERAEQDDSPIPALHAGVACGPALGRGGDWYGHPVNLASRVAGVARRGSALVTREVRDAAGEGFRFSAAGRRRLKGIKSPVQPYRVRRQDGEDG